MYSSNLAVFFYPTSSHRISECFYCVLDLLLYPKSLHGIPESFSRAQHAFGYQSAATEVITDVFPVNSIDMDSHVMVHELTILLWRNL